MYLFLTLLKFKGLNNCSYPVLDTVNHNDDTHYTFDKYINSFINKYSFQVAENTLMVLLLIVKSG